MAIKDTLYSGLVHTSALLLCVGALEANPQAWQMPNLSSLGKPAVMIGEYKGQPINVKMYRNKTVEMTAWYPVCGSKESTHPFAIAVVKLPRQEQDGVEIYIDNKLRNGASGSDRIVDTYFRQLHQDRNIMDYLPRCHSNA